MQLTEQQVLALAPDSGSASNGRKLAQAKQWPTLGRSPRAAWGECQGSGKTPYQVRVDLADFASKCSCPSFKFPCKHALGLLVLAANQPDLLSEGNEPEWVASWLNKRADTASKKEVRAQAKAEAPVDETAQRKRAEKREDRVREGLAGLQRWLEDLVRNGLAPLASEGPAPWEQQASRLVDAQAGALAARVHALADLPGAGEHWPERLLAELGRISLAVQAYERIEQLAPDLQAVLRQYIGFSLREEEVLATGERCRDQWWVIGQTTQNDGRIRSQRTWLLGAQTGQTALMLQFAAGKQPFMASYLPGSFWDAELVFWPGAGLRRALLAGQPSLLPSSASLPPSRTVAQLLDDAAHYLAANPWHERQAAVLQNVAPRCGAEGWQLVDGAGDALPLAGNEHWLWLALSGGHAHALAVEWDGQAIQPMGLFIGHHYHPLTRGD